jgi:hypothetical protein
MAQQQQPKTVVMTFDWRELTIDGYLTLKTNLESIGTYLYNVDAGCDSIFLVASSTPLTTPQVHAAFHAHYGTDEE